MQNAKRKMQNAGTLRSDYIRVSVLCEYALAQHFGQFGRGTACRVRKASRKHTESHRGRPSFSILHFVLKSFIFHTEPKKKVADATF